MAVAVHNLVALWDQCSLIYAFPLSPSVLQDLAEAHSCDNHSIELAQVDVVPQPDHSSGRNSVYSSKSTGPPVPRTGLPWDSTKEQ